MKGTGKKLILVLAAFTVLAVAVTYGCIQYALRAAAAEDALPAEAGIDMYGTYDQNDLIINEIREEKGDAGIAYPQIDGLKNSEVQDAVNAHICDEVERLKTQYADMGTNLRYLSWQTYGSFANVLSIGLFSGDDAMHYDQIYLNFNLNDGSLLRLEDLLGRQADLQEIVRTAFYDAVTRGNLYQTYNEPVSYPDEQELYKTVKGYLETEEKAFAFTPAEIYLYYGDYAATVSMKDFADEITVYHKYLSEESLFTNDGIGYDGIFTCAHMQQGYERREFGFAADNFWYDLAMMEQYADDTIPAETVEQFGVYYDSVYDHLLAEMETLRQTAEANPDRAYILLAKPVVSLYTDAEQNRDIPSCAAVVNEEYMLYEMAADLFESKYLQALVSEYRTNTYHVLYSGIDQYIDGHEVQVTRRNTEQLYNYQTGARLTIDDVFADGYDHAAAVKAQIKYDLMSYYGYSMEDAELAVQTLRYELEGSSLRVYIAGWDEMQYLTMSLGDFPRSALAIFE